jgi:hypothetical protein
MSVLTGRLAAEMLFVLSGFFSRLGGRAVMIFAEARRPGKHYLTILALCIIIHNVRKKVINVL